MPDVRDPNTRGVRAINGLRREIAGMRKPPRFVSFHDGTRERVRLGLQADGKYGLRVWTSAGALTIDNTTS